jgi:hypothetical protein
MKLIPHLEKHAFDLMEKSVFRERMLIGFFAITLPLIDGLLCLLFDGGRLPRSLSTSYYSAGNIVLPGFLFMFGITFVNYYSTDKLDTWVNKVIGILAFGIAFFPTDHPGAPAYVGVFHLPLAVSGVIHLIFTGAFMVLIAFNMTFLLKKPLNHSQEKSRWQHRFYPITGCVMFGLVGLLGVGFALHWNNYLPWSFLMEFVMLEIFGVVWIIKGRDLINYHRAYQKEHGLNATPSTSDVVSSNS